MLWENIVTLKGRFYEAFGSNFCMGFNRAFGDDSVGAECRLPDHCADSIFGY